MRTFTINKITYTAKPFTFNLICDLEEMGVSLQDIADKPMSMMRAYISICVGRTTEYAGEQMEQHIINGGKFDDVLDIIKTEMDGSDFFQALNKTEETITTKSKKSAQ